MRELWARVYEHPDDDEVRRVLADALLEKGDPLGQLIAVQLRLARVPEDERGPAELRLAEQERALLDKHGDVWMHDWPFELRPQFVRGLPERQHTTAFGLLEHWATARERSPSLCEAVLNDEDPHDFTVEFRAMVLEASGLHRLTLPITFQPRDALTLSRLDLTSVTFAGGTLGDAEAVRLAALPLRHLAFEFDVGVRDSKPLAGLPLRSFVCRGNPLAPCDWPALERLTLDRVEVRVTPLRWPRLTRLELFDTHLGRRGLRELLGAGHPNVRRLGLHHERLEASDLALLERWPALEVLDLTGCSVPRHALDDSLVVRRLRCRIPTG